MDRLAAAILIALAALAMNGGLVRNAIAADAGPQLRLAVEAPPSLHSPRPASRSERVMSLLIALEALRASPGLLDTPKV